MSTRSLICKKEKDGKIKAIYCHNDGYINGVGKTLKVYYDENNIDDLIALGDLSSLARYIEPQENGLHKDLKFSNKGSYYSYTYNGKHTFDDPQVDVCVAYHRDRGENLNISEYESTKELLNSLKHSYTGIEYIYLFENNEWKVANCSTFRFKKLSSAILESKKEEDKNEN